MLDPTVQFGVSGTYANDILLASIDPVADPSRLEADSGVAATLTGAITEASAGQPLQFGAGQVQLQMLRHAADGREKWQADVGRGGGGELDFGDLGRLQKARLRPAVAADVETRLLPEAVGEKLEEA